MANRNVKYENSDLEGFLLVDKEAGPTSHDIVDLVRKAINIRKVGHAGTLDPFASGLLLLAIGKATKKIQQFVGLDKTYVAKLRFGATSDTMDRTGQVSAVRCQLSGVSEEKIKGVLKSFTGEIEQIPPMFSAKKVGGKKLYELARKGNTIEREPRKITIHSLEMIKYEWPFLDIKVRASSGTYIRSLAHDIGETLKCGAYLEELRRTAIGDMKVEDSVTLDNLNSETIRSKIKKLEE